MCLVMLDVNRRIQTPSHPFHLKRSLLVVSPLVLNQHVLVDAPSKLHLKAIRVRGRPACECQLNGSISVPKAVRTVLMWYVEQATPSVGRCCRSEVAGT